ncbi:MAG TPA: DNA adenine methylase, partial [Chloroflexi bacterium]|nr:DNA adenine methylase [Chloroflexota bacterium]
WNRLPAAVVAAAQRLKKVTIENADWQTILRRYDAPSTLFYCDPPYLGETRSKWGKFRKAYRYEFADADHRALAEALQGVQGMVVLSGYAHPLYAELYEAKGWVRRCMSTINQNGSQARECLWLNPAAQKAGPQPSLFETVQ